MSSSPSKPITPRTLFVLVLLAILVMIASSVAMKTVSNLLSEATSTEAIITHQLENQPAYTKTTKQTSHLTLGAKGVIISGSVDTVVEVTTNDDQAEALGGNNARATSLQTF